MDRATLEALKKAGADLSKATEVLFYLYFPTRELALKAAELGGTPTLKSSVSDAADDGGWLCLLQGDMVPTVDAIRAESARLLAVAGTLGGKYDGWEAAVTR